VCFDLAELETGLPFKFNRDAGARLGVMPRTGTNADVRWFEIDPTYLIMRVLHAVGFIKLKKVATNTVPDAR